MNLNLATKMDAEQVRRLVGNDNCIVIFVDEGTVICDLLFFKFSYFLLGGVFNPILSSEFGLMPQFFVVVQPFGSKYRYVSDLLLSLFDHFINFI